MSLFESKDKFVRMSEKDIAQAQKWLRSWGSGIKVTGKMSIGMASVLFKYQREHNLPITGELDGYTWSSLRKENSILSKWKKLFKK